jgi:excisionase family DNA binding protein
MLLEPSGDELLTPAGVAALLYVDPKTVTRWAVAGKLDAIRTPGGHRRYLKSDVLAILEGLHPAQEFAGIPGPRDGLSPTGTVERETPGCDAETRAAAAARAAEVTAAAVVEAADVAAGAASRRRGARELAANQAARAMAREAVRTAKRVEIRATVAAAKVEQAAAMAVEELPAVSGGDEGAARAATHVADTVEAAARATAQDTAMAAMVVARAVDAAAAQVARIAAEADDALEREVARTAAAILELTMATAERVAAETRARVAEADAFGASGRTAVGAAGA